MTNRINIAPSDFTFVGSFSIESGLFFVGDPCALSEYTKNQDEDNESWTLDNSDEPYSYSYQGMLNMAGDYGFGEIDFGKAVVFLAEDSKNANVYAQRNDEDRISMVVISIDEDFKNKLLVEELTFAGFVYVNTAQLMAGDPQYLADWDVNEDQDWNLENRIGDFSYFGASATTIANDFGVLGDGKSVVFNTGYGDGSYDVFIQVGNELGDILSPAEIREAGGLPRGSVIKAIVIDFLKEIDVTRE